MDTQNNWLKKQLGTANAQEQERMKQHSQEPLRYHI